MKTTRSLANSAAINTRFRHALVICQACSFLGLSLALALPAAATAFSVTNLVTDDQSFIPAQITDPNLINAWGISHSPSGPFWVSSNGKGLSTVYTVDPASNVTSKQSLEVAIPGEGSVTGQVFNTGAAAGNFNGDAFLFVSEDGTVSGWRGSLGTSAEVLVPASDNNSYKGVAISVIGSDAYLYAANFKSGAIDVFKGTAAAPALTGTFSDPTIPDGFKPFNVQNLGDTLYVTYALRGPTGDDVKGLGNGYVNAFDLQGNLLGRVGSAGNLDSPWGLALAPASFLGFAGDLLVGNFGDGRINVFDPDPTTPATFIAQLLSGGGSPIEIDGLWGLIAGNGGNAGSTQKIYFSAGPGDEEHGLFGVIQVPEPASAALVALGITMLGVARRRKQP